MASAEGDMTRQRFTATKALEHILASEDEGPEEGVSEEKDGEEYDPEHDDDGVDDEEAPDVADAAADDNRPGDTRADDETYLSKNGKIAVVRAAREEALSGTPPDDRLNPDTPGPRAPAPEAPAPDNRASKRKRCQMCPSKKDRKTHTVCGRCNKYICKDCSRAYCTACANWGSSKAG
ncbi:hypothetical protein DPEC_G00179500 [Dallia pectoralis]|uniref:Uncharacterized protein n=1 Tax=Dallia pectoralis TaxID=75939 RepID=A0ACC2GF60_DALPE|nr:hypothetical protein DPEC_G00179500 [Dallia pectoralis]